MFWGLLAVVISISHDLELIYARGEGEKGRGGKGRGKGEKKRGGEKESFLHFRGLPTPTSVQLPHCNAFQRESREPAPTESQPGPAFTQSLARRQGPPHPPMLRDNPPFLCDYYEAYT